MLNNKQSRKGFITKYGTIKNPNLGFLRDETGEEYPFLSFKVSPDFNQLLREPSRWPTTPVYFDVLDDTPGEKKTAHLRLHLNSNLLLGWAYFKEGYTEALEQLKDLALPEQWSYSTDTQPEKSYPILDKYLQYTFLKLKEEGSILQDNECAVFNTGLVDYRYQPICAFFKKNPNNPKVPTPWFFDSFCIVGEEKGKEIGAHFSETPKKANFFSDPKQLIYEYDDNHQPKKPDMPWNHILVDNIKRLPPEFIKNCIRYMRLQENTYEKLIAMSVNERENFYKTQKEGTLLEKEMRTRIDAEVKMALVRVAWNFKTAVPMWYPQKHSLSFLLPLCLVSTQADVALVVERQESGKYQGQTILPLQWAYSNARLICRPDSDWLSCNAMKSWSEEEEEESEA